MKVAQRANFRKPTYDVHAEANLNMLCDRVEYHQMKEAYRRASLDKYRDNRNLNTRAWDGPVLKLHTPNGVAYTRSLEYTIASLWNSLEPIERNSDTLDSFMLKQKIKLQIKKTKLQPLRL